jgi:Tfp pilus assembly protein PilP
MSQRAIFFVALVCIAQLGLTLVRNFWSHETRRVQHVSLSQGLGARKPPPSTNISLPAVTTAAEPAKQAKRQKSATSKAAPSADSNPPTPVEPQGISSSPALIQQAGHSSDQMADESRKVKADTVTEQPPSPVLAEPASPSFASNRKVQLRDPFVPFFSLRKDGDGNPNRALTEYDLSELKLTAILGDSSGRRVASLETPQGRDFVVYEGSAVGIRGGKVSAILPSKVIIAEPSPKGIERGGMVQRELALKSSPAIHTISSSY